MFLKYDLMFVNFQGNQRFLYPQQQSGPVPGPSTAVPEEDDGLGPLPPDWERRVQPEGNSVLNLK